MIKGREITLTGFEELHNMLDSEWKMVRASVLKLEDEDEDDRSDG